MSKITALPPPHWSAIIGATAGPPVNGGCQRWSTAVNNHRTAGQPPPYCQSTIVRPSVNHRSTVVNAESMSGQAGSVSGSGCHVDHSENATWHVEPETSRSKLLKEHFLDFGDRDLNFLVQVPFSDIVERGQN
ncbi:hypothetical protein Tco_1070491 [Tanacetum coccineum]|uniref:Uncharacterized protein n=1 Tax=Tanacetum coccineum TaxID=301880 RepID=A0ABQ5HMN6_9ASTR